MQQLTLLVAVLSSTLVLVLPPARALAVYVITLFWYPGYLALSLGVIDLPVGRIVAAVLLLRCLLSVRIRTKFNWISLDTWTAFSMVVYVGIVYVTRPTLDSLVNRGGFLMETWFAYLAARLAISSRVELVTTIKWIAIALIPLALLGVYESYTHVKLFEPLVRFCPWIGEKHLKVYELRWGLTRAIGPFSHCILFGCCFAMFLPLVYYLRHEARLAYFGSVLVVVGGLSSMSSGPWIMIILVFIGLSLEHFKQLVKPIMLSIVMLCIFVGVISNRPFYHVLISYANPLGGAGWHRARMLDVAIMKFSEWWMVGYGGKDPDWGRYVGMGNTDITNQFILAGVNYGILGVIALCGVLISAFRVLYTASQRTRDYRLKSLYWALGSGLFSVVIAWQSVSFFGQMRPLFYIVLGLVGATATFGMTCKNMENRLAC